MSPDATEQTVQIDDGSTVWRFERTFLESNWTCLWGRGCLGILEHPAEELGQGCCSIGAELADEDEARLISALAAMVPPERFQFGEAAENGVFDRVTVGTGLNTRLVDGACIFLNRPGFAGGAGCALHLGAVDSAESPIDWKPSVCWQLPLRVDWAPVEDGSDREVASVRKWSRADWGDEGETMAWCCTEGSLAYVGELPVVESLAAELSELVGSEVYVELRRRLNEE